MNGLAASSPDATTSSVGEVRPERTRSQVCTVDSASTIMIATSPSGRTRPAMAISKVASLDCSTVGKPTHWSPMRATRTPPTGPLNGRPASVVEAEPALMARTS